MNTREKGIYTQLDRGAFQLSSKHRPWCTGTNQSATASPSDSWAPLSLLPSRP